MDEFIKRISERLADQSSRRGFFAKMCKAALGAAALLTGQGFFAQAAEAAPACCTGGRTCSGGGCPSGAHVRYTWVCHSASGRYTCHDCYRNGRLVCIYATHF